MISVGINASEHSQQICISGCSQPGRIFVIPWGRAVKLGVYHV
jgi:hypothetical protein